jgi:hypothetical protein
MPLLRPLSPSARRLLEDIEPFSRSAGKPLRAYQAECARAIVRSVCAGDGRIISVMFARQMGKNETSAQVEAYLLALYARRGGTIVKAAPSFKPQLVTSMLRLKDALDANPLTHGRWKPAFGYMAAVGKACVTFLSADSHANVVGATAGLLLEIDEAQDVDPAKYDREFRPMASSTNATTVLYGTAWSEDSLLQRQREINLAHERRTGERLHFEFDWRTLAAVNAPYRAFVEGEIARLGSDHPSISTQYWLRCLSDAGRLFSGSQQTAMEGKHDRCRGPHYGRTYVAGIDLAGEDEQAEDARARALVPKRDSTVVTIAEVTRHDSGTPSLRVVDHVWWTGPAQVWQYERLLELWDHWGFAGVSVDASGIGAGIAAFLAARHRDRVESFVFTAPSKSKLAYTMLGMINTGKLTLYASDSSPEWRECWSEIRACRYWLRSHEQMGWGVPPAEGHDDFVASLALCCNAAAGMAPQPASVLIRAQSDYEEGW